MHPHHVRHTFVVCLALAGALAGGCANPAKQGPTGAARVVVRSLTSGAEIARVTVTVSKGAGSDFTPIVADLERSGAQWIGRIASIPVGRRQFDVVAYDAAGVVLYTGTGWGEIVAQAAAVVSITLSGPKPPPYQNALPVIDSLSWSRDQVAPGGLEQLIVTAHDPNPGDTLTYLWKADCGSFDDPTRKTPRWTAPGAEQVAHLSITVTDNHGLETISAFTILVTNAVGDADVNVTVNQWPVINGISGSVTLGPIMQGDLVVDAFDPDGDLLTYAWTSDCTSIVIATLDPYGVTTPHFSLLAPPVTCSVTVTVSDGRAPGGTQASVHLPAGPVSQLCHNVSCGTGQLCDPVDGLCKPNPNACMPVCTGKVCGPDGCGGSCGACSGTCDASGQCVGTCTPACGGKVCGPDGCGGSCGTCSSGTCDGSGQCVGTCTPVCTGKVCGPDGCGGSCGTCSSGTCDGSGQCVVTPTFLTPHVARDLQLSPPSGIAIDASGNTFVAGNIFTNVDVNFQTRPGGIPALNLRSLGGIDAFVAKYDASGDITWAVTVADDDSISYSNDQTATSAAVTANGMVATIGKIVGTVTYGTSVIGAAAQLPYVGAFASVDGARLWGKGYNLGANGLFKAIAASPVNAQNRIAVCGSTNIAATQLVPGTTFGGLTDLVIAVFDSNGNKVWAAQLGGTGNESCNSVAIDDNGDVYATGQFDGASLTFPGATPITLTGPGVTTRKFMWVAKFAGAGNGTGGASTLAAAPYSGTNGVATPNSLAIGPTGDLVAGGQFTGNLTIGAAMTSPGGDDAFVAKLDGITLAPVWNAIRFGGTSADLVKSVSVTSFGDIVVTGTMNPSTLAFRTANGGFDTNGAVSLNTTGTAAPDMFVVKLDGATGAAADARAYGDAGTQNGDGAAVNRFGGDQVSIAGTLAGTVDFGGTAGAITAAGARDTVLVFGTVP